MRVNCSQREAFTLIELLVVIAIIMVLAGLVLVGGVRSRAKARAASCANQMRQVGMALGMSAERGVPRGWTRAVGSWHARGEVLLCPDGPQDGATNYGVNEHLVGRRAGVSDTGTVVLLYESKRAGDALVGDESDVDWRHLGGSNFVFLDGHTRWSREAPEFGP